MFHEPKKKGRLCLFHHNHLTIAEKPIKYKLKIIQIKDKTIKISAATSIYREKDVHSFQNPRMSFVALKKKTKFMKCEKETREPRVENYEV